jgi:hypothetical protein
LSDTAASNVEGGLLVGAYVTKCFGALTVLDGVNFALAADAKTATDPEATQSNAENN